ncbi:cupin domain-containing protein [Salininema proteolyticum]|uniref:Cupin domain-containing protein n=1 Tax=Salininema proteolyticum TaxID=1607685 RepID=A0ABV8TYV9_9ACTN
MNKTSNPVHLARASSAEKLDHAHGSVMTLLADAAQTSGHLSITRSSFPKGADGAPPHFHTKYTESLFVISGRLQVLVNESTEILEAGDFIHLPASTPHAFGATSDSDADVLAVFSPAADRFDYYRLLERVVKGSADASEIPASSLEYDNNYVPSPAWEAARAR